MGNTDTRLDHNEFFKQKRNRQIAARELGGALLLNTFLNIWRWQRKAAWADIQELQCLLRRLPIDRKDGTMSDRILTQLSYAGETKCQTRKFKLNE